jgi:predicted CXXCH cytochrome family protein
LKTELSILETLAEKGGEKMKKALLILGGVMLLTLGAVGMASANAGPHGDFGGQLGTTDKCAGCHRAHTAVGEPLLKTESVDALCESCHLGTSFADPFNSMRTASGLTVLNGGGFEEINGTPATSSHRIPLVGGGASETAWGSDPSGLSEGVQGELECTSCHNPHGSSNYRILKDALNGHGSASNPAADRWVPSDPNLLNWQNGQVLPANSADYGATDWNGLSTPDYTQGINLFCATCHRTYYALSGSAGTPSTDTAKYPLGDGTQLVGTENSVRYRHTVSRSTSAWVPGTTKMMRYALRGNDPTTTNRGTNCLMCHFAHGTTATMSGYAAGSDVGPLQGGAANLLYDNRGICANCHAYVTTK